MTVSTLKTTPQRQPLSQQKQRLLGRGVRHSLAWSSYVVVPEHDTGSGNTINNKNQSPHKNSQMQRRAINTYNTYSYSSSNNNNSTNIHMNNKQLPNNNFRHQNKLKTVCSQYVRLPEAQGLSWTDDYFDDKFSDDGNIVAVFDLDYSSMAWDLEKLGFLVFAILLGYVFDFALSNPLLWLAIAFCKDDPNLPRTSWLCMSLFSLLWFAICYHLSNWTSNNNVTDTNFIPHVVLVIILILCLLYWRYDVHRMIRAQHVAVTSNGIRFVQDATAAAGVGVGETSATAMIHVPFEEISGWELIQPPGSATFTVHIYSDAAAFSDSCPEKHLLSLWGLKHPLKFKRLVRALAKLQASSFSDSSYCAPQVVGQHG